MPISRNHRGLRFAAALLIVACSHGAIAQRTGADIRHLNIVAHQDDDVLFINPETQNAIRAGHTVQTVYLTAGACANGAYFHEREAGSMAAYSTMAGVRNNWTVMQGRAVREIRLTDRPNITLIFFRLPIGHIDGTVCTDAGEISVNLKALWLGQSATIPAIDGSAVYSRDQLTSAVASVIREFHPSVLNTQDSSGFNGTGRDPSGITITYDATGLCDFYDNSDHYYGALFARAAMGNVQGTFVLQRYRGYNIANETANVFGIDVTRKQAAFQAYSENDPAIPSSSPPFCAGATPYCLYDNWQERQYPVDVAHPPDDVICP
jgi:LmbE family N-acetylglucosaminyl deacetylase